MTKTRSKLRIMGLLLTLVILIGALGIYQLAVGAADNAPCTVNDCGGSYANGICSNNALHCEPAVQKGVGDNGQPIYGISNAGQLFWFAAVVNGNFNVATNVAQNQYANAILITDIDLNAGYTFTVIPDTGLVEIKYNGTVLAYLGTGIKGDSSGDNTTFDESASLSGEIYLNADDDGADLIDISGIREWVPIGDNNFKYMGSFNGNGKTVRGLYINSPSLYQGLFGYSKGTIKHVGVANSYIRADNSVGGIVGYNEYGYVAGCYNESTISGRQSSLYHGGVIGYNCHGDVIGCHNAGNVSVGNYGAHVGGIVGHSYYSDVIDSHNTGNVSVGDYGSYVGGIMGYNYYSCVIDSYNTGNVCVGDNSGNVGGIVGYNYNSDVIDSHNTGSVSVGDYGNYVGGIVGYNNYSDVIDSHNTGSVSSANSSTSIGGIAGNSNYGGITGSQNEGNVSSGDSSTNVGGVVGYICDSKVTDSYNMGDVSVGDYGNSIGGVGGHIMISQVTGCYNTGDVSTASGRDIGGVAGNIGGGGSLRKSYNTGNVNGDNGINVGGVVGYSGGVIKNVYNTGNVSGENSDNVGGVVGNNVNCVIHTYNIGAVSGRSFVGSVIGYYDEYSSPDVYIVNNYYLAGTAEKGVGSTPENNLLTIAKSEEEFRSGAVAYLFNEYVGYDIWGQTLTGDNRDASPVFVTDSNKVYYGYTSCDASQKTPVYSNVSTAAAEKPAHQMAAATCTAPSTCAVCGHTEGEALGHDLADATCTVPSTCTVCGHTEGEALGHSYDNAYDSTCDVCGEERTVTDRDDGNEGLSGGAIAGIAVGSAAAVGVGGFSLFWFVIKKKKWSDLVGIFKK